MNFQLHERLKQDCISVGRFELCQLLLMNDSLYPWYILVPEIIDARELYHLSANDRLQFIDESCYLAESLASLYNADKMNVANLGNMVPQLHIHHIVRYTTDKAWPGPIWGIFDAVPYSDLDINETLDRLKTRLHRCSFFDSR